MRRKLISSVMASVLTFGACVPAYAAGIEISEEGSGNLDASTVVISSGVVDNTPPPSVEMHELDPSVYEIFMDSRTISDSDLRGNDWTDIKSNGMTDKETSNKHDQSTIESNGIYELEAFSDRWDVAENGGYKYAWHDELQLDALEELQAGNLKWTIPGKTDKDIKSVAAALSEITDLNPYYCDPTKYTLNSRGEVKIFERNYEYDFDEMVEAVVAKVDYLYSELDDGTGSDWDQAMKYSKWLRVNANYDKVCYNWVESHPDEEIPGHHVTSMLPYGVLIDGEGMCGSYAQSLMLLLRRSGIKAIVQSGILPNGNGRHQWVVAEIDGEWMMLDPTAFEAGGELRLPYDPPESMDSYHFSQSL